ncbi:hypothetical protein A9Z42_0024620 [Trichoderma parareesei]|uniref:Uncharacterized protein n=1 Tax=Trichoderma parareesei TaxID=858221 RepID=A0A2H2ZAP9_TRIPA|nr:hypothetical protein A9Z42_0024620 [Trichoderma parareesei]
MASQPEVPRDMRLATRSCPQAPHFAGKRFRVRGSEALCPAALVLPNHTAAEDYAGCYGRSQGSS